MKDFFIRSIVDWLWSADEATVQSIYYFIKTRLHR